MCISFGLIFCTKNEILNTKAACPFSKRRRRVMKKMTRRRITALFMAVLMVVGILPLSRYFLKQGTGKNCDSIH